MNQVQYMFVIFFAIFWGTSLAAQSCWKPFNLSFLRFSPARHRAYLSFIVYNMFPIIYIWYTLNFLNLCEKNVDVLKISYLLLGILPAFAMFGFNKLWLGIVEIKKNWFYGTEEEVEKMLLENKCLEKPEPYQEMFYLESEQGWNNISVVPLYMFISIGIPFIIKHFVCG